jgi:uncharacterized protein (TIGR04255 family)
VAAEVRYPPLDELAKGSPAGFHERIRAQFPIREEQNQLAISVGPGGPSTQQTLQQRFTRRDRLMSVTLGRDSVILETTAYPGWAGFSQTVLEIVRALETDARPDGVARIGLRYVDEVRVPASPQSVDDWKQWIDERLVAPFTLGTEEPPTNGTVVLQYGEPPGYVTVFRASPFASGRTVQEEGALRMPFSTPDGPYFLLDTDTSWVDPTGAIPEFTAEQISVVLEDLHRTSGGLFEASISERLKAEVLSRPREEVWSA